MLCHRTRILLLALCAFFCFFALFLFPRFGQDNAYHDFADQRTLWNVPHALNVLSNLPFVLFGLWGAAYLLRHSPKTGDQALPPWESLSFLILFVFVALTGIGSMYYHAQPRNDTLFWDRLPLTVVFMTFYCLVLADRIDPGIGPGLLLPLVLLGVLSVTYWHWSEQRGAGDVRLYAFVQFFPLLTLPLILLLFPAGRYRTAHVLAILAWYALAKLLELLDQYVFAATGLVSGHTLKHLAASLGALWVWVMLRQRLRTPPHGPANRTLPTPQCID